MRLLDILLAPGDFIVNHLSLRAKLAIVGLIFIAPSVVILQQIHTHHARQIDDAARQRLGLAQLGQARSLLGALAEHRGLVQLAAAGVPDAKSEIRQAAQKTDAAFTELESVLQAQGDPLATAELLAALAQAWQALPRDVAPREAEASFAQHSRLIRQGMDWMIAVADRSGLVTDAELDSHYLIIMALNRLPMLAETIAALRGQTAPLLAKAAIDTDKFAMINRRMGEVLATLRIVERGLDRVIAYNPRANALLDDFRQLGILANAFQTKAGEVIFDSAVRQVQPRELFALGSQVIAKADAIYVSSLDTLDTLMLERIAHHKHRQIVDLGLFIVCLLIGLYFLLAVAGNFRRSIAAIEAGSRRLASADFSAPFRIDSRDEFGQLGSRLDDMRRQLYSARELEEKKQAERNALIVNAAMDGFFSTDLNTRILDCNDSYCTMLGYRREEMLALQVADIEAIENPAEVAAHAREIFEKGIGRFDTRHRRKDGSLIDVEVNIILAASEGSPTFFAFVHDITPRKRAEAALQSSRDEAETAKTAAETANAAKSEFLSRMSHELRTPLNAIIGFAHLLEISDKHLDAQQTDNVREILQAGHHLLEQVNEVLDLSRIESGRLELNLQPLAIAALARDCIAQIRPLADERRIAIETALEDALAVHGDAGRVRQVLINLLSNAIKYNRDGGTIRIVGMPDGERVRIEVRDTGRGMPAEHIDRLFKPFERLHSAYDGIEGTGIGLALVKRLVEAMGGAVGAESEEGVGSCFWFLLPLAQSAPAEKVGAGETTPTISSGQASRGQAPRCVLYIEDNPVNLKLVRKLLGPRPDIELFEAENAAIGLQLAQTHVPAAILLDLNLPDMDGFTVIQKLRENAVTREIPVIAISANAMPHEIKRGQDVGFAAYLTKPLDIRHFLETLEKCLAAGTKEIA